MQRNWADIRSHSEFLYVGKSHFRIRSKHEPQFVSAFRLWLGRPRAGWVRTAMTGDSGLVDAYESVAGMTARTEELTLGNSGTFWGFKGDAIPW